METCRLGIAILPLPASPHAGFPRLVKVVVVGVGGIGQDFSPAPRGGVGIGLDFLDSPHPIPSHPYPTPRC